MSQKMDDISSVGLPVLLWIMYYILYVIHFLLNFTWSYKEHIYNKLIDFNHFIFKILY